MPFPRASHNKERDAYLRNLFTPLVPQLANEKAVVINVSVELPKLIAKYGDWRKAMRIERERALCMTWWHIDDAVDIKPEVVIVTMDGAVETVMYSRQWILYGKSHGVIADIDVMFEPQVYEPLYKPKKLFLGAAVPDDVWGAFFYNC